MKPTNFSSINPAVPITEKTLRERASERLKIKHDRGIPTIKPVEATELIRELEVHQIELELQNNELRRTQIALEIEHERYIELYDFAPVGYLSVSKAGLILKANLTASTLLDLPRSAIINQPLSRFILPEDQHIYFLSLKQLSTLQTGTPESPSETRSCELRILKKDQTAFWVQLNARIHTDSNGTPVYRIVLSDITSFKEAVEALRQSEQRESENRFRKIFTQTSEVMLILDAETGRIIDANEAAARFYGWSLDELRQMRIFEINTLPTATLMNCLAKSAGIMGARFEFRHRRADGSIRQVEVFSNGLESEGNKFIISIIHDITERKQFEEQLQTLNNELVQRADKRTRELQETQSHYLHAEKLSTIGKLSASIAHEINNPLQGIMTILKGLEKYAVLDEGDRNMLALAISESERIKNLIQSLHDFNRPSLGKKEVIDVHKSLAPLLLLCKKDFNIKQISVVCNFTEQLPQIVAVEDQIKQVLLNLLTNAAEACHQPGGMITINTWMEEKYVAVAIKDTGTGIAPDKLDQIFQPFYTTKAEVKGTGLGLSISQGIIQKHHGEIRVESKPGEGSTFTVLLPV